MRDRNSAISFVFVFTFIFVTAFTSVFAQENPTVAATASNQVIVKKIKAGFIYVGPVADFGWSYAHEQSRKALVASFPWLESAIVESVAESDCARVIDRLIVEEKCDVVFTTSFGYMNDTLKAAARYPDKSFLHCSGFKRAKNLGTYFAELYQLYYLNGLMAGALTKSGKIGYVAAHPTPEIVRHINALAIGLREVNPRARIDIKWLYSWYDPAKAREAAESLITEGCDVLAFTEDSPAVVQVGQEHTAKGKPVYTFSHYSPMQKYGEDSCVSGQLVDWNGLYEGILLQMYAGVWKADDRWWMLKEGAAKLGASPDQCINPKFVEPLKKAEIQDPVLGKVSVYDLIFKRVSQMSEPGVLFDPFTGPLKDQAGKERLKPGERADQNALWTIDWFIDNVDGTLPR
ncbi:MAG: BMP family ABC transporter substrate-binding protein [Candidatus Riflebacteria bacterium]|nr:BMP family ABC transporter substrate-binding protein [Candidatus Riflebacteria bacterium]